MLSNLNYGFIFISVAILYAIGAAMSSVNSQSINNNTFMLKTIYFILWVPLILCLLITIFSMHTFCYELYNAIRESGLTVKEFVGMIQ